MANINAIISLGIGSPGDITHFTLFGLTPPTSALADPAGSKYWFNGQVWAAIANGSNDCGTVKFWGDGRVGGLFRAQPGVRGISQSGIAHFLVPALPGATGSHGAHRDCGGNPFA